MWICGVVLPWLLPGLAHLTGFSWRMGRREGPRGPYLHVSLVVLAISGVPCLSSTRPLILQEARPASFQGGLRTGVKKAKAEAAGPVKGLGSGT